MFKFSLNQLKSKSTTLLERVQHSGYKAYLSHYLMNIVRKMLLTTLWWSMTCPVWSNITESAFLFCSSYTLSLMQFLHIMLLHNYINYTKVTTGVSTLKTSKTLMHIFLVFFPPFFNKNRLLFFCKECPQFFNKFLFAISQGMSMVNH